MRFVKISSFKEAKTVFEIDFSNQDKQKPDEELVIGTETKEFLAQYGEELSHETKKEFYKSVRQYFVEACSYIKKKFPLQDVFLTKTEVVDITTRASQSFSSVEFFIDKFPRLLPVDVDKDLIEQEFLRYQIDKLPPGVHELSRMDEKWHLLRASYPHLSNIMLSVLSIPHSNADSERVFSAARRIQTDFRQSMDVALLENLISVKQHLLMRNELCYTKQFTEEFLSRAKSATYLGLKAAEKENDPQEPDPLDNISAQVLQILNGESLVDELEGSKCD